MQTQFNCKNLQVADTLCPLLQIKHSVDSWQKKNVSSTVKEICNVPKANNGVKMAKINPVTN